MSLGEKIFNIFFIGTTRKAQDPTGTVTGTYAIGPLNQGVLLFTRLGKNLFFIYTVYISQSTSHVESICY